MALIEVNSCRVEWRVYPTRLAAALPISLMIPVIYHFLQINAKQLLTMPWGLDN